MNLLHQVDRLASAWLNWRAEQRAKNDPDNPDPELIEFRANKERGLELTMSHPAIAVLANDAESYLKLHNAVNYVEMEIVAASGNHILITLQYKYGLSPHQKEMMMEEAKDVAQARVKALEAEIARLREALEVYADDDNWLQSSGVRGAPLNMWNSEDENGFDVARKALNGEQP